MRITHFMPSLELSVGGGVTRFVLDAAQLLAARGHHVEIVTCDAGDAPPTWLDPLPSTTTPARPFVRVFPPHLNRGQFFARAHRAVVPLAIREADVLHLHGTFEPATHQVASAARREGIPYLVTIHGMLDHWALSQRATKKRIFMRLFGKRFLRRAAAIHVTSQGELDQAKPWFPGASTHVVPCPFDLPSYLTLPGTGLARARFPLLGADRASAGPLLLFLARLHPQKGAEFLVRAAGILRREGLPCRVALAGKGEDAYAASLLRLAEKEGIADRFALLGPVTGDEKSSLYQNADVFVLPTMQESFGLVLVESMACGTPVISTFGVDIWQDLADSGAAEIVHQDDRKLADAIRAIVSNPAHREDMARKARDWVFRTFDEPQLGSAYESLYAKIARTPR